MRQLAVMTLSISAGIALGIGIDRSLRVDDPSLPMTPTTGLSELSVAVRQLQEEVRMLRPAPSATAVLQPLPDRQTDTNRAESTHVTVNHAELAKELNDAFRRVAALQWRISRVDPDGVLAIVTSANQSPFDSGMLELVEEAFSKLDELRARIPLDVEVALSQRALAQELAAQLEAGSDGVDDRGRVLELLDQMKRTEDSRLPDFLETRQQILNELAAGIDRVRHG